MGRVRISTRAMCCAMLGALVLATPAEHPVPFAPMRTAIDTLPRSVGSWPSALS